MDVFVELMKSATSSVEFSFNDTMYKKTDGIAMGSPLGSALADTFIGYYEEKLFFQTQKSPTYLDLLTTRLPSSITKLKQMNFWPNSTAFIHPSTLKEKCQRFLDVYIKRTDVNFATSVYWKPTFTGQYLR